MRVGDPKKVLLIAPHSQLEVFSKSKIRVAIPHIPYLSLAVLASPLINAGHGVQILDLSISKDPRKDIFNRLNNFPADFVGVTATTALFQEMCEVSKIVKEYNDDIKIVGGGVHLSTLPEDELRNSEMDIAVVGEGDYVLRDIVSGIPLNSIRGIWYKDKKGQIRANPPRELIKNLDDLPFPAWHLYDISKYKTPRINCRENPVGAMETSRGCVFACTYCNKSVFGRRWRAKSPKRVVDEMEYMLNSGFREIHIWEDGFSTDLNRAKEICDEIIKRRLDFSWNIYNGIRVDRVDKEFLEKAYKAGCYRISFGIESGNPDILKRVNKGIDLDDVKKVFKMTKEVGIETTAFLMVGMPGETKDTMQDTINFTREIEPDIPKVGILMPLPGTPLYEEWNEQGYIKSKDWSKYVFHAPVHVYDHPNLDWKTIYEYYNKFYRELYLNPKFITKRFVRDIRNGELLYDAWYFLKTLRYGW